MPLRTRHRLITDVLNPGGSCFYERLTGTYESGTIGNSSNSYSQLETSDMVDTTGKSSQTKAVTHVTSNHTTNPPSDIVFNYAGHTYRQWGPNVIFFGYGSPHTFDKDEFVLSYGKTEDEQIADTVDRFYNNNEVDNFTNIVQAHGIPGCLESLLKTVQARATVQALRNVTKTQKYKIVFSRKGVARRVPVQSRLNKAGKEFGKVIKHASNTHLAWSFGLSPLLADIKKLQKSFRSLRSDLQKQKRDAGKEIVVRSRMDGAVSLRYSGRIGATHYNYIHHPAQPLPKRIVSVKGIRTSAYESGFLRNLDYLLNKFGSGGPASFVWEQIPYSFVVDWFLDTRPVINALDNLLRGNSKQINDICVSEKWTGIAGGVLTDEYAAGKFVDDSHRVECFSSTLSVYTRKPVSYQPKLVKSGRFGKKQLLLSWDLICQKVANR